MAHEYFDGVSVWQSHREGVRPDMARCRAGVFGNWRTKQCSRKGKNAEHGYLWCQQHTPSIVKAKREEEAARYNRQAKADSRRRKLGWHGPKMLAYLECLKEASSIGDLERLANSPELDELIRVGKVD